MYDELVKEVQLLKLDENSKVSEPDQQSSSSRDAPRRQECLQEDRPEEDHRQEEEEEVEIETGVDGDDEDDNQADECHQDPEEIKEEVEEKKIILGMTSSKSEQISRKPVNDSDHHTSL